MIAWRDKQPKLWIEEAISSALRTSVVWRLNKAKGTHSLTSESSFHRQIFNLQLLTEYSEIRLLESLNCLFRDVMAVDPAPPMSESPLPPVLLNLLLEAGEKAGLARLMLPARFVAPRPREET